MFSSANDKDNLGRPLQVDPKQLHIEPLDTPTTSKEFTTGLDTGDSVASDLVASNGPVNIKHEDAKIVLPFTYKDLTTIEALRKGFKKLKNNSPGIDGQTKANWKESTFKNLEVSLNNQSYKTKPSKRIYIPKPNGGKRPISISTTRDKVVQSVLKQFLEPK
jgi:hypothetical protein